MEIEKLKAHKKNTEASLCVRKIEPIPTCEKELYTDSESLLAVIDNQKLTYEKYLAFEH